MNVHSHYLSVAYKPVKALKIVKAMVDLIKRPTVQAIIAPYDAIVITGMSGALIAPTIAMRLRKPLVVLRKEADNSHFGTGFEGEIDNLINYIIIDDFICGGSTMQRIITRMSSTDINTVCEGIFLYKDTVAPYPTSDFIFNDATLDVHFKIPKFCYRNGDITSTRPI